MTFVDQLLCHRRSCHNSGSRCGKESSTNVCVTVNLLTSRKPYSGHFYHLFLVIALLSLPTSTFQRRLHRPVVACYDDEGNPRECKPAFDNIALKRTVKVSETCGVPEPESFCRLIRRNGRLTRACDVCEKSGRRSHSAKYLTDINDSGNITYWQSKTVRRGGRRKHVALTISFGKKFELSYIALQFYSPRPASMIIYKSMNNGRKWTPYQYYARSCQARFGLPNRNFANKTNEQEVLCVENSSSPIPLLGGRVVFNPTRGRPSSSDFENSYILQDWVTVTDIKIVLTGISDVSAIFPSSRHNPSMRRSHAGGNSRASRRRIPSSSSALSSSRLGTNVRDSRAVVGGSLSSAHQKAVSRQVALGIVSNPGASAIQHNQRSSAFYAINDITIGGRCKCNGHASRCIQKNNRLVCDCKHNTDGVNCEKCKAFHYDKPWKRATRSNANECVACNCNLHAKKCRFNAELFVKSGGVSGGVCQKCRHHTTGRYCHFCKPGYYKNNKTKSIAHRKVCRTCGCHPVGAAGKICNPATGQCPCKEGVAGKKCNRCAKGFEQTRSRIAPCIRIPTVIPQSTKPCVTCKRSRSVQLTVNKWCKVDYAIEAKVIEQVSFGKWVRVTLDVIRIYKRGNSKLRRGLLDVRIRERSLSCICPRLRKNKKYLLLGKYDTSGSEPRIAINKNTIALLWKNKYMYKKKLIALFRRARSTNAC